MVASVCCRWRGLEAHERRREAIGEAEWMKEAAALLRAAVIAIENLFDPETIVGGFAPEALLREFVRTAEPLPHSIAERKEREAPRIMLSPHGEAAVLRGSAALAAAGPLSPRFGVVPNFFQ